MSLSRPRVLKDVGHLLVKAADILPRGFPDASKREQVGEPQEQSEPALEHEVQQLLARARDEADHIVEEARILAKKIKEEAREQGYTEGLKQGRQEGFAQGEREGRAAGLDQARQTMHEAARLLSETQATINKRWAEHELEVVTLATEIASRIIRKEVSESSRDIAVRMIREAARKAVERNKAIIRVHPDDFHGIDLESIRNGFQEIDLVADPNVEPGGCLIETPRGIIDGQIRTQMTRLFDALLEEARKKGDDDKT